MKCENSLRSLMGMEAISDISQLAAPIDINKYPDYWIAG